MKVGMPSRYSQSGAHVRMVMSTAAHTHAPPSSRAAERLVEASLLDHGYISKLQDESLQGFIGGDSQTFAREYDQVNTTTFDSVPLSTVSIDSRDSDLGVLTDDIDDGAAPMWTAGYEAPEVKLNKKIDDLPDIEFIDLELARSLRDEESEYMLWAVRFPENEPAGEGFGPRFIIEELDAAPQILAIFDGLPMRGHARQAMLSDSFSHLTLPEALVYYWMLNHQDPAIPFHVQLKSVQKPAVNQPMILRLDIFPDNGPKMHWYIHYDWQHLTSTIYEKGERVGKVKYVIRGQKLEEIEGTFHNEPLVLDPVWNPRRKTDMREEHIRIGAYKESLSAKGKERVSTKNQGKGPQFSLSINEIQNIHKTPRILFTKKRIRFLGYAGEVRYVFIKGLFIPVAAQMTFGAIYKRGFKRPKSRLFN